MVAVIKTGHSIHRILNYNENKVKEGVAECISAANYPMDVEQLSLNHKLKRLLNQAALNENVTRNSVHVSLNFDPSEQLSSEQLQEIADTYMQKIGFGEQPYLVYQHFDAGHPHIHVVSVKVRADGSRVDMQNIGRNQSDKARKEIEIAYNLVRAEGSKKDQKLKPAYSQKVQYGRSDSRRAIASVLDAVLNTYKYASLPELNAVLRQYNVMADRGSESSRVYQHKGLLYRVLDQHGNPVGVPIKASSFYNKPTLKFLEGKFRENESKRLPFKSRIKNAIDMALLGNKTTLEGLVNVLQKQGIHTELRTNETGMIYGITYVDHQTKCVFNGSELGKQYSAKGIQDRCLQKETSEQTVISHSATSNTADMHKPEATVPKTDSPLSDTQSPANSNVTEGLLDVLMQAERTSDYVPHELKKNSKKRKRKKLNNNQ